MKIVLSTLNSRYTHSSLALRYIYANLKELQDSTLVLEFSINDSLQSVAEKLLQTSPNIIALGTYIWNAQQIKELIHILKKVSPELIIILGGPEVSHEPFRVSFSLADYIIQGEGDVAFYELCKEIQKNPKQVKQTKVIKQTTQNLKELKLPYEFYTDEDIQNRYIYVEVSRGCPFECEFCLSSMDERVRTFDIQHTLQEFEKLWQRGARAFKFVDRTFNINIKTANKILDFFLTKEPPYFAHFEVIPDHFPNALKEKIKKFPHGALQMEIGIQTLNLDVAKGISRNLKLDKIKENISFLEQDTKAHIHLDLIVGLPGETLKSFGDNLDELVGLSSCEIQIGILKKLSGTYINRHDIEFDMVYSEYPPYDILKNKLLSFEDIQIMKRFARFWDLTYNSGNFKNSIVLLYKDESMYENFYKFSMWIYNQTDSTYKISLVRLGELLFTYLRDVKKVQAQVIAELMLMDMMKLKGRAIPSYLRAYASNFKADSKVGTSGFNKRQH
jgi:radical SAM superfamily enzyme YgiQ (UPF0313 family)